jgi:hypothetical protein
VTVAREIAAALASSEPLQIAVRARASIGPAMSTAQLPSTLASVEVHAAAAADYDALLGGVQ